MGCVYMNMKKRLCSLLAAALLLSFCGCADNRKTTRQFFAMDTVMELTAYGPKAETALDAAEAEIYRLDGLLSVGQPGSEITKLNAGDSDVSGETAELIAAALEQARRTEGAFDPTLYPVVEAWGFFSGDYRVPEDAELQALLTNTGWEAVQVSGTTVALPEGFAIDLGGIGKGYASLRVKQILQERGVCSALISLGGNISALGKKPDGSPWIIAVQNPAGEGYLGTLEIDNQCVITSGGYQRFFEENGVRYWHILDPDTGKPARSGMVSVSIVSDDDAAADALSTALFVMGPERAERFWRENADSFEAVWQTEDGGLFVTEGLKDRFHAEGAFEVICR